MNEKHPYASPGSVVAAVNHFRKAFPAKVAADTLRKLAIAPNNESYVINTLRFVGALDNEGNKTAKSTDAFNKHEDPAFQKAFGEMVKAAYAELFKLHGDEAWELEMKKLISFFRSNDRTSDAVGRRQASTFQALSSLAGHGEGAVSQKASTKPKEVKQRGAKGTAQTSSTVHKESPSSDGRQIRDVGLTVRIEVNLPPGAEQEIYDRIFKSIRENLIDAK